MAEYREFPNKRKKYRISPSLFNSRRDWCVFGQAGLVHWESGGIWWAMRTVPAPWRPHPYEVSTAQRSVSWLSHAPSVSMTGHRGGEVLQGIRVQLRVSISALVLLYLTWSRGHAQPGYYLCIGCREFFHILDVYLFIHEAMILYLLILLDPLQCNII